MLCRKGDDYPLLPPDRIDFMDVAPEQLVSIAAALIPFLEHDDANRALMGSNMQRQSVPLLFPQAPLVGTGLEEKVARDSGAVIIARRTGTVTRVTADEIIVDAGANGDAVGDQPLARLHQHDRYRVKKFWRTNQDTAINQRPLVQLGQQVEAGEIIADGAATEGGELALGSNVLVAFMPWYGHNFEDAIVLSERLVKDDVYSSIHIQELELHVRDTKRGQEEITREIPNVSDESVVDLDERGIVRIGAHVKPGDILVGKITPKGETELSPEEKLLTAIFGEKAKDVKDSSLKVPPGMAGVVIDVKIFSRIEDQVVEKDRGERIGEVRRIENDEKARINTVMLDELSHLLAGQEVALMLKAGTVEEFRPAGTKLTAAALEEIDLGDVDLKTLRVANKAANERIRQSIDMAARERAKVEEKAEDQIDKILQPDELPPGVIQLVKVYIAEKRKISVGDKMAGPARQQGHRRPHRAGRGHAVPAGRHAGGHRPQPARRAEPHERGPDPRDPPGLVRQDAGLRGQDAGLPRRRRGGDRRAAPSGGVPLGGGGTAAQAPGARVSRRPPSRGWWPTSRRSRPRASTPRSSRRHLHARRAQRVGGNPGVLRAAFGASWSRPPRSWPSASCSAASSELEFHRTPANDEDGGKVVKELEKTAGATPAEALEAAGKPALAGMLGPKGDQTWTPRQTSCCAPPASLRRARPGCGTAGPGSRSRVKSRSARSTCSS